MLATKTDLGCFSASRFVPCGPFGPDLKFKLGKVLLPIVCVQQQADPGGPTLPLSPRLLHSLAWPTETPGCPPYDSSNADQFMHSSQQALALSFSVCHTPLLYSRKLTLILLPINQLTARWVRTLQARAASDCDTRDKTPSGINNYILQACILEGFIIDEKQKKADVTACPKSNAPPRP